MGVDHVFDRVGNEFPRGQAVEHARVTHGDAVVDGDGVKLAADSSSLGNGPGHQLAHVLEVHMARDKLGEGIGNGNKGLAEVFLFDPGGAPQGACARHVASGNGGVGS